MLNRFILNSSKNTRAAKPVLALITATLMLSLSACSNNSASQSTPPQTLNTQQQVEQGTVLGVKTFQIKKDQNGYRHNPYGNIGVAAGSGGFRGIYGSIDLATIGRIFNNKVETKTVQEIIVKKTTGETVAITQAPQATFTKGDVVKIVRRGNYVEVIH